MSYVREKNKRRKDTRYALWATICFVVLVMYTPLYSVIFHAGSAVYEPLWILKQDIVETVVTVTSSKKGLRNKIDALQYQEKEMQADLIRASVLENDLEILQTGLERSTTRPKNVGVVVARPIQTPYDTITVRLDSIHSVSEGDIAYAFGDIAIGRAVETTNSTVKIQLYTTPGISTIALIEGQQLFVDLQGRGGGTFIGQIPREILVREGDVLLMPSLGNSLIGVVDFISFDPRDPFQTLFVRSPINYHQIKYVTF